MYAYGASPAFPTSSYASANYWVDVLFQPGTHVSAARLSAPAPPSRSLFALTGCGADAPAPKPATGTTDHPLVATRPGDASTTNGPGSQMASRRAPRPTTVKPGYKGLVDRQTAHPQQRFTPCNLVTRREAERIVGKPMREPWRPRRARLASIARSTGDELSPWPCSRREFAPSRAGQDGFTASTSRGRQRLLRNVWAADVVPAADGGRCSA